MKLSDFAKNITSGLNTAKMLKKANDMKKEVFKVKKECENKNYIKENDFFKLTIKGDYQILNFKIKKILNNQNDINDFQIALLNNMNNIFNEIKLDQTNSIKKITDEIDLTKIL